MSSCITKHRSLSQITTETTIPDRSTGSTVLYSTVQYGNYSIVQYSSLQYSVVQYCNVQYSIVPTRHNSTHGARPSLCGPCNFSQWSVSDDHRFLPALLSEQHGLASRLAPRFPGWVASVAWVLGKVHSGAGQQGVIILEERHSGAKTMEVRIPHGLPC